MKHPAGRLAAVLLGAAVTAATVGVAAGTGAATAASAQTIKAMTWNACANTAPPTDPTDPDARCIDGRQTDKVAATIRRRILTSQPGTQVLFLQEVCSVDIDQLRSMPDLAGWQWKFAPIRHQGTGSAPTTQVTDRDCAHDIDTGASRGYFGVAVGVHADAQFKATYYPDADQPIDNQHPDQYGHWNVRQVAVCASVAAWQTTVCGTHLTPLDKKDPDHPDVYWTAQARQVQDLMTYAEQGVGGVSYDRVIFGGDLNQPAPDGDGGFGDQSTVAPAYARYAECDQANYGGARDGEKTYERADGTLSYKIDYLFTNQNATSQCYVTDGHISTSDHKPVVDTISFPTT
jgi:hypothetical protein